MEMKEVYPKVFTWMFVGLLVTFLTGFAISNSADALEFIFDGPLPFVFALVEIVLVIVLSARINKMETNTARILFLVYSFITGLTFSAIFVFYEIEFILFVFLATALVFGIFAILGYTTNIDLSKLGVILVMALVGVIICSIINMFVQSDSFDLGITIVSLIVFMAFVAYDIQKIKRMQYYITNEENLAICGALELYLDFINIFLDLLKLLSRNRK